MARYELQFADSTHLRRCGSKENFCQAKDSAFEVACKTNRPVNIYDMRLGCFVGYAEPPREK